MSTPYCSNCDNHFGHYTQDCPEPVDWKRRADAFSYGFVETQKYARELEAQLKALREAAAALVAALHLGNTPEHLEALGYIDPIRRVEALLPPKDVPPKDEGGGADPSPKAAVKP